MSAEQPPANSATPRTDEASFAVEKHHSAREVVPADFARELERELIELRQKHAADRAELERRRRECGDCLVDIERVSE